MIYSYIYIENRWRKTVPEIISFPITKIIAEEVDNLSVKACFVNNLYKKLMIQEWEELWNVKGQCAGWLVFCPIWLDDVHKGYPSISSGFELQPT